MSFSIKIMLDEPSRRTKTDVRERDEKLLCTIIL